MTAQEIEEKYNKNFAALKEIEIILRAQEATYDVHVTRLTSLKALADSCSQLKKLEIESMKIAQQQVDAQNQIASLKSQLAQKESELAAALDAQQTATLPTSTEALRPPTPELIEALKKGPKKTASKEV